MKQVGEKVRYRDLKYHDNGWCCPKDGLPLPYDMLELQVKTWYGKRTIPGWWTGSQWYSIRTGNLEKIYRWRRDEERHEAT